MIGVVEWDRFSFLNFSILVCSVLHCWGTSNCLGVVVNTNQYIRAAKLACKELEDTPSNKVVQVLESIPEGLDSLYKELLDGALQQKWARADIIRCILISVAFSLRPLSVLELSEVCQLHLDEEDTETRERFTRDEIASCRLMVIIQDEKVLLLHQSVRDYLERAGYFDKREAHADLAYRCVDLLIEEFHCGEHPAMDDFALYAAQNWPNHVRMAESRFAIRNSQLEFLDIESPCREQWLGRLRSRSDSFLNQIPRNFSLLHIAARWGLTTLARDVYHKAGEMTCLNISDDVDFYGATPLELAAESRYPDIVSVLMEPGEVDYTSAAGNEENGEEVMKLLLGHRGNQINITEEVLKAAAGNREPGEEVMMVLLDRRRDQVTITEEVLKAAARNWRSGEGLITLLLDRQGDQVTTTEGVVKAAAGNWTSGKKVIVLLLGHRAHQIIITDEVVSCIARRFDQMS